MKNETNEQETERRGTSALTRLLCRFLPWRETQEEIETRKKRNDVKIKKHEECCNFAEIGDTIKYIGVNVTVVGYDKPQRYGRFGVQYKPGLRVEWFNTKNEIQRAFIKHSELQLCKKDRAV